jgi:UDP-N-acetylmuramoyl-tripeptide--D-alanyl-D-alanine ligase
VSGDSQIPEMAISDSAFRVPRAEFGKLTAANLAAWSGGVWRGQPAAAVDGVCIDTRQLKPGNLFFALHGDARDGHEFVAEAFRKGACGAVVAVGKVDQVDAAVPCLVVRDPAAALRAMAAGRRRALNAKVIAVTGSVGKSTVKEMTAAMLSARYRTGSTRGNWNNDIGLPLSFLSMDAEIEAAVVEMGTNHPGEVAVLCEIAAPDCGIVTNVGPVHTEFFGTVDAIAEEKSVLLQRLPRNGLAVLSKDHDYFDKLAGKVRCELRTVSFQADADLRCRRWDPGTREALVLERGTGEEAVLRMPLPGAFNVANALLAAAAARWMGVPWPAIGEALGRYGGMPLRWQEIEIEGRWFVNDSYNANPMNMRASIRVFRDEIKKPVTWLLLAGMLELGAGEQGEHLSLGRFVGEGDWAGLIVLGELGGLIADGALEAGVSADRIFRCRDRGEALEVLRSRVAPSSAVLVKGSRRFQLEKVVEEFRRK